MGYNMKTNRSRLSCLLLIIFIALSQYSCGLKPLQMSKSEISEIRNSEGIVFGSILVKSKEPEMDSMWQTILKGRKVTDFKYEFIITKRNALRASHKIIVEPNDEKIFVAKLEGGEYDIIQMFFGTSKNFLTDSHYHSDIHALFTVIPNKCIYIGRLMIPMPERIKPYRNILFKIEDDDKATISKVILEYGINEHNVTKKLMYFRK